MSAKVMDAHGRWRSVTVAFRVSPEEDSQIETLVRLSGLTKQYYILNRLLNRDVVVHGNPRVYKALRDQLASVLAQLQRIEAGGSISDELTDIIHELHRSGTTIVLISHNMDDVARIATRVAVLEKGRLAMLGTPRRCRISYSRPDCTTGFAQSA